MQKKKEEETRDFYLANLQPFSLLTFDITSFSVKVKKKKRRLAIQEDTFTSMLFVVHVFVQMSHSQFFFFFPFGAESSFTPPPPLTML